MLRFVLLALAVSVAACSSSTAPVEYITLQVQHATLSHQPDSQYTLVRIEARLSNEGAIDARPFLCAFALQKDTEGAQGFVTIAASECNEGTGSGPDVSSKSFLVFNLLSNPRTADVGAATRFRILLPVFLGEAARQSTLVVSEPFMIVHP
ncbi:MAG: hypothetical protein ACR2GK_09325 [Gemmatimonadaceae bacterium]